MEQGTCFCLRCSSEPLAVILSVHGFEPSDEADNDGFDGCRDFESEEGHNGLLTSTRISLKLRHIYESILTIVMINQIFVNLPVRNLKKTREFFTKLGFMFNPKFSDENAVCMIISNDAFAMLLVEKFFKTFTKKQISDAKKSTEVMVALSVGSRGEVDEMMSKVVMAGGKEARAPEDLGYMYGRAFEDLDGHIWEVFHMDESQMPSR